jgi:hypothetical protein
MHRKIQSHEISLALLRVAFAAFMAAALPFGVLTLGQGISSASTSGWIQTGGPEGGEIRSLVINPQNPATVYAGTYWGGVFKSNNNGNSWGRTGLTNGTVTALAIDPHNPTIVYAGTDGGGVFVSSVTTRVTLDIPAGGAVLTATLGPADELISGYATGTVNSGSDRDKC